MQPAAIYRSTVEMNSVQEANLAYSEVNSGIQLCQADFCCGHEGSTRTEKYIYMLKETDARCHHTWHNLTTTTKRVHLANNSRIQLQLITSSQ